MSGSTDRTPLQLYATGFNAQGQLSTYINGDFRSLRPIFIYPQQHETRVLFTGWSSTVIAIDSQLIGLGYQKFQWEFESSLAQWCEGFGNHERMYGCLDGGGKLYCLLEQSSATERRIECLSKHDSPKISHIAVAGNDKVAVTFLQSTDSPFCSIYLFDTFQGFLKWFHRPFSVDWGNENRHLVLRGRPRQLLANTATFMLLMESGEVYTWGDPRQRSLGRSIEDTEANYPGLVDALDGVRIKKIACGGWMSAALSEEGGLHIWGTGTPGTDQIINPLRQPRIEDVVLVQLPPIHGDQVDFIDVGVGDNHIAALTERHELWVIGDGGNGQLGYASPWHGTGNRQFAADWAKVPTGESIQSIACGPKATFAWVKMPV